MALLGYKGVDWQDDGDGPEKDWLAWWNPIRLEGKDMIKELDSIKERWN